MSFKAKVFVTPRKDVLDPQGKAVSGALHALGYGEVEDVRIGRVMEVRLRDENKATAQTRLDEMCRKLLANPTIEDYRVEIEEERA